MSSEVNEVWRWVPGYEGRYEVSNLGGIRSWAPPNGRNFAGTPRTLKATKNYAGYRVITLRDASGVKKQHRLHCLVLLAFVGPRPAGYQGAHHNDDKEDNRLVNLAWKTVGENTIDRHINGRTARGTRHGGYKDGRFVGTNRRYYPPKYVGDLQN